MTGTEHRDPLVRTSPCFHNNSDVFGDYTATLHPHFTDEGGCIVTENV